ncbi:MAG: fibronectin type III domain-containing protein [Nitrospinae bacterium]|nr:fibronectin type III domain-containing protein [Nitrospinota bacterium]
MKPVIFPLIFSVFLASCGGGGGGTTSTGPSAKVTITGTLSSVVTAKPSINVSAAGRALSGIAWAGATLQVIDASGAVIGAGTVNADGTYAVSVAPGGNYIIRVQSGNLVLKAFVPDVSANASVNVTPTTTAEVMVLAQVLGVANVGDPGVNAAAAFSSVNVGAVVTQITANPNIASVANTLAANIAAYYDAASGTASIGAADTAVSSAVTAISAAVSTTAVPSAPSPPAGIGVAAGNGQVIITWTAVAGAASYNVYYRTAANVTTANGTKVANAASGGAITGLTNGTAYYFVVTAVNAGGESAVSAEVGATPQVPIPGVPSGIGITAGNAQVVLGWTAIAGAASYNVYYRTAAGVTTANGTKVTTATSSCVITGLTNGTAYYFVVTAVNAGGESAVSGEVNATPQNPPGSWTTKASMVNQRDNAANAVLNGIIYVMGGAPAGVGILDSMEAYDPAANSWTTKAAMPAWSTISITPPWSGSVYGPPAYRYGPAAAAVNGLIYLIGGTSLVNGQGPIYPIAVYNPATNTWSSTVPGTGTTLAPIPTGRWGFDVAVVDGLIYAVGGAVRVPGGITTLDYTTKITGATIVAGPPVSTTITGLTNGKNYSFIVTAVNGTEGAASFEVSATPQASYTAGAIPANLGTAAGNGQVTISWTAVTGAASYNVYYSTKPGVTTSSLTKVTGIGTTSTTVTGLANGTKYYFIVTAVVGGAETVASSEVSTTPQATPAASVPSNVAVTGGDTQVTLTWTAPTGGAASYNVYYGTSVNIYYGTVEAYDPVANTWTAKAAMPTPRWGSTVSVVNGLIYAIGGWGGWPELSLVEIYNPATNTWSTTVPVTAATTAIGTAGAALAPMPTARDDFGFAVVNGVIYAIGGDVNTFDNPARIPCCTTVVEAYDTVTNTWSTKTPAPTIRDDFDASVVDGVIYAIAGSRDGKFTGTATVNPDPALDAAWLAANDGGFSLTTVEAFSLSSIPVPAGVTAATGANQVSLSWNAVAGATSYNIYWSNKAGVSTTANSTKITGVTSPHVHTGLTPGTWYYYVVTAVTASGESLPSNEAAAKP